MGGLMASEDDDFPVGEYPPLECFSDQIADRLARQMVDAIVKSLGIQLGIHTSRLMPPPDVAAIQHGVQLDSKIQPMYGMARNAGGTGNEREGIWR